MEDRRLLFFDIDGTLFDCAHGLNHVTDALKAAISELKANGHLCFVASGRPYAYLNQEIRNLGFDGFVLCNGALIYFKNEILLSHYFGKTELKRMLAKCDELNIMYCLTNLHEGYLPERFTVLKKMLASFQVPMEYIKSDYSLDDIDVAKLELFCQDEAGKAYARSLKEQGYVVLEYVGSGNFEINMPHVSKGNAIEELCRKMNIPLQNTIAFGDGDNDIEMLRSVGHGVAMGNATENAKKAADVVTECCVDDGIVKELKRLHLIGE